jgi:hypothetical protein
MENARSDQTDNKQTSNKVAATVRINVSCWSRSDKLICANKAASQAQRRPDWPNHNVMTRGSAVMATKSLSPNRVAQKLREHRHAVIVLARQSAKKAIKAQLRAEGLKLSQFSAKDQHPR